MSSRPTTRQSAATSSSTQACQTAEPDSSSTSPPPAPVEQSNQQQGIEVNPPQEPPAAEPEPTVLSRIWCPFQETRICIKSKRVPNCPFGHLDDTAVPPFESELTDLPSYACAHHLLNRCPLQTRKRRNSLKGCDNGFHLESTHLKSLSDFEEKYSSEIARFEGTNHKLECAVCLEQILTMSLDLRDFPNRRFGVLDTCGHIFCAKCILNAILAKLTENPEVNPVCPVCRGPLNEISIQRAFPKSDSEKLQIFLPSLNSCATIRRSMLDEWIRKKRPERTDGEVGAGAFIFGWHSDHSDSSSSDDADEEDSDDEFAGGDDMRNAFQNFIRFINRLN